VPFVLSIVFIILQLVSYANLRKRIKKTDAITELVLLDTFDKFLEFFEMAILAIHIGYLFQI
ncbi:hypothetical protein, partial [Salmonella enterica]|uniref:hypothetical protein n=1 Tax=Salmonella enterica TaxID=28901 RepID=UPI000CC1A222